MQYLGYFAHGQLYKGLQRVIKTCLKGFKYLLMHPLKSIWFVIKAYIGLMLLVTCLVIVLTSFTAKAQVLYENSSSENPYPSDQIRYKYGTGGGDDALFAYSESGILSNFHSTQCNFISGDTTYQMTGSSVIRRDDGTLFQINCDRYSFRTTATGTVHSERNDTTGANTTPRIFASEICGENASGPSSYTFRKDNLCYDPAELAANDTCDTGNLFQADSVDDTICGTKNDGSMCESERVISVLFSPNGSGACYFNADVTDETVFPEIPPPETCVVGADGFLFCASNGEINNGFDKDRYCGSYNIGGGATEVCFDKDDDNDLIPNHTDTDLDGDGIENLSDEDHDNDGILNVNDTDYTPNTGGSGGGEGGGDTGDTGGTGGGGVSTVGMENRLDAILEELEGLSDTSGGGNVVLPDIEGLPAGNDYETRNYGTVMLAAVEEMRSSPVSQAVDGFFTLSLGGTCPIYSTSVPYMNTTITIDQFCGSVMNSIWPYISAIMIVVFSVLAFRVAIL
jgi:hypothetical protein